MKRSLVMMIPRSGKVENIGNDVVSILPNLSSRSKTKPSPYTFIHVTERQSILPTFYFIKCIVSVLLVVC